MLSAMMEYMLLSSSEEEEIQEENSSKEPFEPEPLYFIYKTKGQWELRNAILAQQWEEVNELLTKGGSPIVHLGKRSENQTSSLGYQSPLGKMLLHSQVMQKIEIIEKFLELGVDVNEYASINPLHTPLDMALSAHLDFPSHEIKIRLPLVKLLLSKGADVTLISHNTLKSFITRGNIKILEVLLEYGLDPKLYIEGKSLVEHLLQNKSNLFDFNQKKDKDDHQKIMLLIERRAYLPRDQYIDDISYIPTLDYLIEKLLFGNKAIEIPTLPPILAYHITPYNENENSLINKTEEFAATCMQSYVRKYLAEKEFSTMKEQMRASDSINI